MEGLKWYGLGTPFHEDSGHVQEEPVAVACALAETLKPPLEDGLAGDARGKSVLIEGFKKKTQEQWILDEVSDCSTLFVDLLVVESRRKTSVVIALELLPECRHIVVTPWAEMKAWGLIVPLGRGLIRAWQE